MTKGVLFAILQSIPISTLADTTGPGRLHLLRISLTSRDEPRRKVRDTKVEDLSGLDDEVEGVHQFFNTGSVVEPMDVEYIDLDRTSCEP